MKRNESTRSEAMLDLFDGLATSLLEALNRESGPTATELNVIRQFLKDNSIDCDLKKLAEYAPETPAGQLGGKVLPFAAPDPDLADEESFG